MYLLSGDTLSSKSGRNASGIDTLPHAAVMSASGASSVQTTNRNRLTMFDLVTTALVIVFLNNLPKYPDCGTILEPVYFTYTHGVWWINVERKPDGFGYFYPSLMEAVRRWNVIVVSHEEPGIWRAVPIEKSKE